MMEELTGSRLRKLQRAILAQGFDARSFSGGRTVRVLCWKELKRETRYTHMFVANLSDMSIDRTRGMRRAGGRWSPCAALSHQQPSE